MSKVILTAVFLNLAVFGIVQANEPLLSEKAAYTLKTGTLSSSLLARDQLFEIYLPDDYQHSNKRYPVIYVLDGDFLMSTVINTTIIRASRDLMPESIVVGLKTSSSRDRLSLAIPAKRQKSDTNIMFANGKPGVFIKFLQQELMPFIEKKYRTANFKSIVGMSPTAGVVYTDYLQDEPVFDAHIALTADPNLYTVEGELLADKMTARDKAPNNTFLYVSRGEQDLVNNQGLKSLFEKLSHQFAESTKVAAEVIPDSEHYGMSIEGINRALIHIFPTNKVTPDYIALRQKPSFVEALKNFYHNLNEEYGFEFYPLHDGYWQGASLAGSNRYLLRQNRSPEAIELLKWALNSQPNNIELMYNLTWAYEENKQIDKAIKAGATLVELAQKQDHSSLEMFKNYLNELRGLQAN